MLFWKKRGKRPVIVAVPCYVPSLKANKSFFIPDLKQSQQEKKRGGNKAHSANLAWEKIVVTAESQKDENLPHFKVGSDKKALEEETCFCARKKVLGREQNFPLLFIIIHEPESNSKKFVFMDCFSNDQYLT